MQTEITKEVFARLDALAEKLGVTAQYLWTVLLKQAHVEAVSSLCWAGAGLMALVGGVLGIRCALRMKKDKPSWTDREEMSEKAVTVLAVSIAATFIGLLGLILNLSWVITPWLNPEFWALQQVLQVLGK